jgi:N-glycosylase/DNA lyase
MTDMSTITIPVNHFYLKDTFESGQPLSFHAHYDKYSDTLTYITGMEIVNLRFSGTRIVGNLVAAGSGTRFLSNEISTRFRLNDDMEHIYDRIATDDFMKSAIEKYDGMRLTINDPWETALCFIISQYNNMKRIRGIVKAIINKYGDAIKDENDKMVAKSFPTSATMASASERDLMECGAGFRAKYIKEAAAYCTETLDLDKLKSKKYPELKEELLEIKGVGDKVADCIALMGYGKLEAFPIDVWVKRTMEIEYFKGRKKTINELHRFALKKWGEYAGYAQQYIFWQGMHMEDVTNSIEGPEDKQEKPAPKHKKK